MQQKANLVVFTALIMVLVLLTSPVTSASPTEVPALQSSPRPPLSATAAAGEEEDDDASGPRGAIIGTVTDLNLGQPGRDLDVSINGAIVRTDTDGRYSITGLHAGEYIVSLQLPGGWSPAQNPISVSLDGQNSVTVDLGYYSQSPPTATPAPTATLAPPSALPESGAPTNEWLLIVIGFVLVLAGTGLFKKPY